MCILFALKSYYNTDHFDESLDILDELVTIIDKYCDNVCWSPVNKGWKGL